MFNRKFRFIKKIKVDKLQNNQFIWNGKMQYSDKSEYILKNEKEFERILKHPLNYEDDNGYNHVVLGFSKNVNNSICFVEEKYKKTSDFYDVSIKFIISSGNGSIMEKEIISYNPFFGCTVNMIGWIQNTALMIYTEKHFSYVTIGRINKRIIFKKLWKRWKLCGNLIGFYKNRDYTLTVLNLPNLKVIGKVDDDNAIKLGIKPV